MACVAQILAHLKMLLATWHLPMAGTAMEDLAFNGFCHMSLVFKGNSSFPLCVFKFLRKKIPFGMTCRGHTASVIDMGSFPYFLLTGGEISKELTYPLGLGLEGHSFAGRIMTLYTGGYLFFRISTVLVSLPTLVGRLHNMAGSATETRGTGV